MIFTWKRALGVVAVVIAIACFAGLAWFKLSQLHVQDTGMRNQTPDQPGQPGTVRVLAFGSTDYTGWATYHSAALGLTVKVPSGYQIDDSSGLSDIYIVSKNPDSVRWQENTLARIQKIEQVFRGGKIYTDTAALASLVYEDTKSDPRHKATELVSVNGIEAVYEVFDTSEGPLPIPIMPSYAFIRGASLVYVYIWAPQSDYIDGILQSIQFDK